MSTLRYSSHSSHGRLADAIGSNCQQSNERETETTDDDWPLDLTVKTSPSPNDRRTSHSDASPQTTANPSHDMLLSPSDDRSTHRCNRRSATPDVSFRRHQGAEAVSLRSALWCHALPCRTAPHCTALHRTALHCALSHSAVPRRLVLLCAVYGAASTHTPVHVSENACQCRCTCRCRCRCRTTHRFDRLGRSLLRIRLYHACVYVCQPMCTYAQQAGCWMPEGAATLRPEAMAHHHLPHQHHVAAHQTVAGHRYGARRSACQF